MRCAHTAGDTGLGANVLGFMSEPARDAGRLGDATTLTATALAGYQGTSPHVLSILHMRAALACAADGDELNCRRAIDRAQAAPGEVTPESGEPDWCYWMDEGMLYEQVGTCLMWLDDHPSASGSLELSLHDKQNGQGGCVREGALRLTRLATACARQCGPERACDIGGRAIDAPCSQVDSARLTTGVRRLRGELAAYRGIPGVRAEASASHQANLPRGGP